MKLINRVISNNKRDKGQGVKFSVITFCVKQAASYELDSECIDKATKYSDLITSVSFKFLS